MSLEIEFNVLTECLCILGGRVDMFHISEEHMISGIFIKHVLEDSPAGKNGTLKTGDRILKVRQYINIQT